MVKTKKPFILGKLGARIKAARKLRLGPLIAEAIEEMWSEWCWCDEHGATNGNYHYARSRTTSRSPKEWQQKTNRSDDNCKYGCDDLPGGNKTSDAKHSKNVNAHIAYWEKQRTKRIIVRCPAYEMYREEMNG